MKQKILLCFGLLLCGISGLSVNTYAIDGEEASIILEEYQQVKLPSKIVEYSKGDEIYNITSSWRGHVESIHPDGSIRVTYLTRNGKNVYYTYTEPTEDIVKKIEDDRIEYQDISYKVGQVVFCKESDTLGTIQHFYHNGLAKIKISRTRGRLVSRFRYVLLNGFYPEINKKIKKTAAGPQEYGKYDEVYSVKYSCHGIIACLFDGSVILRFGGRSQNRGYIEPMEDITKKLEASQIKYQGISYKIGQVVYDKKLGGSGTIRHFYDNKLTKIKFVTRQRQSIFRYMLLDEFCPEIDKETIATVVDLQEYGKGHAVDNFQSKIEEMKENAYKEIAPSRTKVNQYGPQKCAYLWDLIRRNERYYKEKVDVLIAKALSKISEMNTQDQKEYIKEMQQAIDNLVCAALNGSNDAIELADKEHFFTTTSWPIPNDVVAVAQLPQPTVPVTRYSSSTNDCSVCFEELGEDCVTTHCGHTICKSCFKDHVRVVAKSKNYHVTCFQKGCKEELHNTDVLHAELDEVEYATWKQHQLINLPKTMQCPRQDCGAVLSLEGEKKKENFLCVTCYIEICRKCHFQAHKGMNCKRAGKVRKSSVCVSSDEVITDLQKKKIIQSCPRCKTGGIRATGCSQISCPNPKCGKTWTYQGSYRG